MDSNLGVSICFPPPPLTSLKPQNTLPYLNNLQHLRRISPILKKTVKYSTEKHKTQTQFQLFLHLLFQAISKTRERSN